MRILLTGAAGQLGKELYPRLSQLGEVIAVDHKAHKTDSFQCLGLDLSDEGRLETLLNRQDPDIIVNAAAYTAVDRSENEPELTFAVNSKAPGRIARWVARNKRALLHYSTDYVFDGGTRQPYVESDRPSPLNTYGESKLAGELAIAASGCRHVILRSSWVYSSHGNNFVLSMLQLARRGLNLQVIDDQIGRPTWARNLAAASSEVIRCALLSRKPAKANIYHCCDRDMMSWYDFAVLVFDSAARLGLVEQAPDLNRVSSDQYPQAARRPGWSVLDCSALTRDFNIQPSGVRESLLECLKELPPHEPSR